jgi:hypothetical protein
MALKTQLLITCKVLGINQLTLQKVCGMTITDTDSEYHTKNDIFVSKPLGKDAIKDDMASMEHPIFSLKKKADCRNLKYVNGKSTIEIIPCILGLPTIHDKDILIYCASIIMREINNGNTPSQTLRIKTHDFLVTTQKSIGGRSYGLLKDGLDRLKGTMIKTNIRTGGLSYTKAFSMIDSYEAIETDDERKRLLCMEIKLSDWLYNAILAKEMLTLNPDYFKLNGALERRIYEIARKHLGMKQKRWEVSLEILRQKSGSIQAMKGFKFEIKKLSQNLDFPDYHFFITGEIGKEKVIFQRKKGVKFTDNEEVVPFQFEHFDTIRIDTIDRCVGIARKHGLDYNQVVNEYWQWLQKGKSNPDDINGAIVGFFKKKAGIVESYPSMKKQGLRKLF